jgi:anti-anti-sigma regulatory factor
MPFWIVNEAGRQLLKLEGAITVRSAQEFAAKMVEGAEIEVPFEVDTTGLTDIDTCILQLLCSLRKTVPAFCFDRPSEVFIRAAERCGLRRELLGTTESL